MSFKQTNCEQYWKETSWIPIAAIINEWCNGDQACKTAKEYAVINACEKGDIAYRRSDGKTFNDPVEVLHGRGILLIDRGSFFSWVERFKDPDAPKENITTREKNNLHSLIGGLLVLLLADGKKNQSGIITQLTDIFKDKEPFKQRTLESKFSEAKRAMSDKGISFDDTLNSLKKKSDYEAF
ncbi:hypothetical protein EFZ10_04260 [Tatumella sp. TA1]|nr:hypothetical protein EFZ10_04260 [Tatumella sp. TA1]